MCNKILIYIFFKCLLHRVAYIPKKIPGIFGHPENLKIKLKLDIFSKFFLYRVAYDLCKFSRLVGSSGGV